MVDEATEDEVAASLARLRMFLAPHNPEKCSSNKTQHESTTAHTDSNDSSMNEVIPNDVLDEQRDGDNEDLVGDLSTLAEYLAPASDDCIASGDVVITSEEPIGELVQDETETIKNASYADDILEQPTPATDSVATVSPTSSGSREYAQVKYLLQCSLPGFRVHDDMVMWDMKNPTLVTQYEALTSGLLELSSWVEVDKLSAAMANKQSDPPGQPMPANTSVMKFATGSIVIDPFKPKTGRKQLVLCKIAVGRAVPVESEEEARSTVLLPGYHSYYLQKNGNDSAAEGSESELRYWHEYILNDALQILPLYLVRFSYSAIETKASHPCALCETHAATLHCKACDAELCTNCDVEVHSANKLVERHKRTPLRERSQGRQSVDGKLKRRSSTENGDTGYTREYLDDEVDVIVRKQVEESMTDFHATCQLHEGKKIEFYCPICTTPVCVNCKMVGDHSIGEKGAHRLLSIGDAYEQCLRESFKSDPLVDSRRSVIESKLSLISQWEKDVQINREQVEAVIKQQYDQAIASLNEEVKKKTSVLKGEAFEFIRQLQQIEWLETCLEGRRSSCSIVEFLSSWNQHKLLRVEQRDFPTSSHAPIGGEQVKADLQLVGNLQVVSGDHLIPRLSFKGIDYEELVNSDNRCSQPSPRGSIGSITSPPASVRRTSDNDMRRKLLSMRSIEKRPPECVGSPSPNKAHSGMGALSPEGRKMMEEIRNDLFARRTVRSSSGSQSPLAHSPLRTPPSSSVLRTLTIQPTLGMQMNTTISAPPKQRTTTAAWTALLRRELKDNGVAQG